MLKLNMLRDHIVLPEGVLSVKVTYWTCFVNPHVLYWVTFAAGQCSRIGQYMYIHVKFDDLLADIPTLKKTNISSLAVCISYRYVNLQTMYNLTCISDLAARLLYIAEVLQICDRMVNK